MREAVISNIRLFAILEWIIESTNFFMSKTITSKENSNINNNNSDSNENSNNDKNNSTALLCTIRITV